jgi:hypothetical protein
LASWGKGVRSIVERFIRLLVIGGAVAASLYAQQPPLRMACAERMNGKTCRPGRPHSGTSEPIPGPRRIDFESASGGLFPDSHRPLDRVVAGSLWPSPFSSFEPSNLNRGCGDSLGFRTLTLLGPTQDGEAAGGPGLAVCAQAQQPPASPSSPSSPSSSGSSSPKHLFYVVPAYNVAYAKKFKPLTPRQKFREWLEGVYDPRGLALIAAEAATLEHSGHDGFCGYGHGFGGYAKCYGSMELDLTVSSFFGDALFPTLLHQDPRYFRLGKGSAPKRISYALSRVFVTHADSGRIVFYSSALSGSVLAAAASNLYYPRSDRGFSHSVNRLGIDLADTAAFDVAAEYWPDIQHLLQRIHGAF